MREKTAVFIGHNECYDLDKQKLKAQIAACIENGITTFLSGGQGGFDRAAARAVYELKAIYPQVRNLLVIPYLTFTVFDKTLFDQIVFPENFEKYHFKAAIIARNKYMVQNAAVAVCFVRYPFGGAAKTYAYAQKNDLQIINLV